MALIIAGTRIAGLNEAVYDNKLWWEGSSANGDISLPTIEDSPLTRDGYAESLRWALNERSRAQDDPSAPPSTPRQSRCRLLITAGLGYFKQ